MLTPQQTQLLRQNSKDNMEQEHDIILFYIAANKVSRVRSAHKTLRDS